MYLISAYFDEQTNKILQGYINKIVTITGNSFMVDNHVPPHITLSAIEARGADVLIPAFESLENELKKGDISLITVGQLMPKVVYVAPYLNEYLQYLENRIYDTFVNIPDTTISKYYRPFSWLPHVTLAKTLNAQQMLDSIQALGDFKSLKVSINKIGLAKVNPHEDIREIYLK